ncbi:MAG: TRAP transporter substrate-binding protein DctP [Ignavibacteriae bacterium]|nr:TRAP transporter substrate-binding protein DctP [Ignavibacteriota bacterium]
MRILLTYKEIAVNRLNWLFLVVFGSLVYCSSTSAQEHIIKFATIAPEGTTWMNVLREYDAAIRKESKGRLGFKIYAGGVQGEDKDVLRKIRLGQLHSAGLTGFGLGEITSKVRILDAPFLFEAYGEVDHVYSTFGDEFEKAFLDNGYVLLGWAEVGFVYVFTNSPVRTLADMNGVKMWMWEGDQIAEATFKALGLSPIPLGVIDVLTSFQTGLINGAYNAPLAAIGMQWHSRVKYMLNLPLADASGAVVISKQKFDSLPRDLQEILVRNGEKYMRELTRKSRQENAAAVETLKKFGIQIVEINSPKTVQEYWEAGKKARRSLVGKLYDEAFLDRVEKAVADYRSKHSTSK